MRQSLPLRFPKLTAALCGVLALFVLGAGKKISDYTETLELGDAWIYEIAVPGVTNYKVTFGTIATNIIARTPASSVTAASNALYIIETTRNAAVSNSVVALISSSSGTNTVANMSGKATNLTTWGGTTNRGNLSLAGSLLRPQLGTVRAIGDSITAGSGVAAATNAYVNIIASNTTWTISNLGISSREMPSFAYAIQPLVVATNDVAFLLTGYNDMRHWGTNASGQRTYEESLRSALVYLSIPDAQKHWISTGAVLNARFTKTGAWEHHNLFYAPNRYSSYSATAGGTITCTMYGSAIYVGFTDRSSLAPAGSFTITIDGVLQTTVYPTNNGQSAEGESYWSGVARVSDLAEGAHTVLLTISGGVCLDWVAGNDGINGQRTPMVYSAGCLSMRTNAYALGTPYNNGTDEAARQLRLIHDRVVSELAADGLGVVGVDAYRYFSPHADELNGDFVHPNEAGHVNIARSFLDVISGVPTITERQGSRFGNEFAGLLYRDKQRLGIGTVSPGAVVDIKGDGTSLPQFHVGTNAFTGLTVVANGNVVISEKRLDVESLTTQFLMAYDADTYATVTVGSGGVTTFVSEDSGSGDGFAFQQTADVAYVPGTQTTYDLVRAINTSTTSGAAAGIWGIVGGQNVGGIAFVRNGTVGDSGSTALLYANGSGMAEGMRVAQTGNVGINTNAPGYKLEVNGDTRITGAVMLNNGSPAAGQVPTFRSDGTIYPSNVVATASGTNFPPVTTTGTNITVGTGVMKSLLMPTNASVGISFNGTEILGENVTLVVTNTSANASNITISVFQDGVAASYFDSTVASNVTGFLVVSNSSKRMEFVYNGSFWRLESTIAKEMELSVAGGLSLTTNSVTSIVTLSNSLALQQLNNVGIGTPAAGDVLSWSVPMSKWTNTVVPGGDVISNITVSATNNVLLDFAAANIFKLTLLTNWTHTFTNATSLTKKGYVYFQQDTNGNRMLNNYSVSGGLLQTNASENMQPTTNANALDLLELMPGFFTTNLIAYWPQDFQPRIKFTNSLHAFLSFIDTFNRSNADPMSTTASDGNSWTSGPGALAEPRIVSSMLFGNAGQTGCRVLTPAMGGNQRASLTLIGNVGALGPMVHVQSTIDASGYFLVADDSTHLAIYKLTDTGSLATSILFTSAATPTMVSGDTITLTINGITLECFLNGVSYGTVDDATFSGGQPGIWMNSDSASGGPFSASEQ